jgi:hypothetical protein
VRQSRAADYHTGVRDHPERAASDTSDIRCSAKEHDRPAPLRISRKPALFRSCCVTDVTSVRCVSLDDLTIVHQRYLLGEPARSSLTYARNTSDGGGLHRPISAGRGRNQGGLVGGGSCHWYAGEALWHAGWFWGSGHTSIWIAGNADMAVTSHQEVAKRRVLLRRLMVSRDWGRSPPVTSSRRFQALGVDLST